MEDDARTPGPIPPRSADPGGAAPAVRTATAADRAGDPPPRAGVFASLVKGDGDIIGLVAYSIYKQHKLDWLRAFEAAHDRPPSDAELASYIIGEATPRRLATYRHLADATLEGQGPHFAPAPAVAAEPGRRRAALLERAGLSANLVAIYALIAVTFAVGIWLALRFTATSR